MIAGHTAGQKQGRDYRDHPAGQRKPFSRPRPRRPKGPSLILSVARQDLAEAARLLCNFHAWGERTALLDRQAAACAAGPNWIAPGPSRSLMASNASISLSSLGSHLSNSETCA